MTTLVTDVEDWPYPGARWWKFDFHTHTPASIDYGMGSQQSALKQLTPEDWLLGFMRAGVDCVAVTDHNSGEWVDKLKAALFELEQAQHPEFRRLHLFPGVEITANSNVHVLALLDTDRQGSDVSAVLGAVGYKGVRGASDVAADAAAIEVVEAIVKHGGIPILAHVDGGSGAWSLSGNSLTPLFETQGLYAIEVVNPASTKPTLYLQKNLSWAEVLGSDSHHPYGGDGSRFPGSHYTWIKMAEPSLAGLRLALIDGKRFSVRRSDDPATFDPFHLPQHYLEAIEIDDARYMGRGESAVLKFSPWLNALVGGRGTGKSTVIHALRLASRRRSELGRLDETSEPRMTFSAFDRIPSDRTDKGGLTADTSVHETLMRDGVRHRLHWCHGEEPVSYGSRRDDKSRRTSGLSASVTIQVVPKPRKEHDPVVEEFADGSWQRSASQSVTPERFPIRIFSQGQIAALASDNQQALLQLIDDAAGVAPLRRKVEEAQNTFYATRSRIREIELRLGDRSNLVVELQDVERKLKRFEDAGHTAVLTSFRLRDRQHREVDRQFKAVEGIAARIESAAKEMLAEDLPDGLFAKNSKYDQEVLSVFQALADAVRTAAENLSENAQSLLEVTASQQERLSSSGWRAAVDAATRDYEALVDALHAEGVADPSEYGRLVQERQRLEGELQRLDSQRDEQDRLIEQSETQLSELQEKRRVISDARDHFLNGTLAQNRFVRIRSRPYGDDLRVIERSIREALGVLDDRFSEDILNIAGDDASGIVVDLLTGLPDGPSLRRKTVEDRIVELKRDVERAAAGEHVFGGHFSNYLSRESARSPELLDRLLAWFPEDALVVEYSRLGDGEDFQPITQASAGQRAAAMLAFLLAHGEEPLVLDQPEDDLDNHLIYDLVVRQIRENKTRRQIIVVTHNPNIVVNGDAEMLHALDFRAGQCRVVKSGSLQDEAMREEVCRVMEGGREAFERRYRRLGREPV